MVMLMMFFLCIGARSQVRSGELRRRRRTDAHRSTEMRNATREYCCTHED